MRRARAWLPKGDMFFDRDEDGREILREALRPLASARSPASRAYKLTMAELRVLFAIVDVGGVPEVAEVLGIAATTVKTHLGNVFAKTGANRQADLVKLVAGFANPLMK